MLKKITYNDCLKLKKSQSKENTWYFWQYKEDICQQSFIENNDTNEVNMYVLFWFSYVQFIIVLWNLVKNHV